MPAAIVERLFYMLFFEEEVIAPPDLFGER